MALTKWTGRVSSGSRTQNVLALQLTEFQVGACAHLMRSVNDSQKIKRWAHVQLQSDLLTLSTGPDP